MANEYLQRTPTSAGNRKVWTWSGWIKIAGLPTTGGSGDRGLFSAVNATNGGADAALRFSRDGGSNPFQLMWSSSRYNVANDESLSTVSVFRDTGNWMHVLFIRNTPASSSTDRVRFYINGIEQEKTESNAISLNEDVGINETVPHAIGDHFGQGRAFRGEMSDVFFVDGQALTPDVFGFHKEGKGYISVGSTQATDFRPGQWLPKSPRVIKTEINRRGGFGVNGFYLPMNDQNNFGADHHMVPDTIIKLNTDLPQPKVSIASTTNAAGLAYTDVLRADPYADDLVLAVPGIGTIRDYSPFINSTLSGVGMTATIDNAGGGIDVGLGTVSAYYGEAIYKPVRDGSTIDYTPRTSTTAYGTQWTIEFWCNIEAAAAAYQAVYHHADAGSWNNGITLARNNDNDQWTIYANGTNSVNGGTFTSVFESWQHIAAVRDGSKLSLFQNGVCVGIKTNYTGTDTTSAGRKIGLLGQPATNDYASRGYIQDLRVYIGTAKYDGGFDVPKLYRPVGIETFREVPDVCVNNFATFNPSFGVGRQDQLTYTKGNLKVVSGATSGSDTTAASNMAIKGKIYCEFALTDDGLGAYAGVMKYNTNLTNSGTDTTASSDCWIVRGDNEHKANGDGGSGASYGTGTWSTGDIIMLAVDIDNTSIWWGKNGTWYASGNPSSNSNAAYTNLPSTDDLLVICGDNYSSETPAIDINFGQNPTFGGTKTAGTNTDANGRGLFTYTVPTGFLALCEDNLPTPAIADPGEHFKTVLYTGDGNNGTSINGFGFKPDLIWLKGRSATGNHGLWDSVRGATSRLSPNLTNVESTSNGVLSFDDDGFSRGTPFSSSGSDYVVWGWKAGGAATANTDGSINSTVSANQTAGFSIVSYTGNSTSGATVGHGLGKAPSMIIVKSREAARGWNVYHQDLGNTKYIQLQSNAAEVTDSGWWNDTSPNSSTFTLGNDNDVNGSGVGKYIAYCWAEIEGYSKFGSYVGNGNADGPFVYCGFKPAWVMVKRATTGGSEGWPIYDSSRGPNNPNIWGQYANDDGAQNTASGRYKDFLSNGFKPRGTSGEQNTSGVTYIFMAFAESPFQTANAK